MRLDSEQAWYQVDTAGGFCSSGLGESERSHGEGEQGDAGYTLEVE